MKQFCQKNQDLSKKTFFAKFLTKFQFFLFKIPKTQILNNYIFFDFKIQ